MKKIPTLFERQYENHKWDGSACAVINDKAYKRYDAKKGKPIPEDAIKCQEEPDPITAHIPCWVPIKPNNPADKWFVEAFKNTYMGRITDDELIVPMPGEITTFEAVGPHFQGNPYYFDYDKVIPHGSDVILESSMFKSIRTFDKIQDFFLF